MVSTEGSFRAGVDGAQPGVYMQAHPQVGRWFRQEWYQGHAEDQFRVIDSNARVRVPYGSFRHALRTEERTGFRMRARQTGRLEVRAAAQTSWVDPARVRQALENLVENALRHGGGPITVTAALNDGRLRIEVQDRGLGFPKGFLPAAFDPFTRGPTQRPATTPEDGHPGAGLGLAIVRAIAEAHGGTARAVNDPAGGTRVRIDIAGCQPCSGAERAPDGCEHPAAGFHSRSD